MVGIDLSIKYKSNKIVCQHNLRYL